MQKQQIIWNTAPAFDIALQLVNKKSVHRPPGLVACESSSPRTASFPLAFTIYTILSAGLVMLACGIGVQSSSLTLNGFVAALAGTLLYGLRLCYRP